MLPFLILFHFGAFNIIGYVLSSLIFYFLIGLLIDKIIYKFKRTIFNSDAKLNPKLAIN